MKGRGSLFHDMRSSLNGVICMGSLLEETDLSDEQRDILKYMLLSADKTLTLIEEFQNKTIDNDSSGDRPDEDKTLTDQSKDSVSSGDTERKKNTVFSVLIAEDDSVSRLYLTTLLKRQNWHIDEACDGLEALALFEKNDYQLILMDVSMPGVDGIQAAQKIRRKNKDIPILAITAHGEGELQEDFIQAGMSDVLRKPIIDEYLLSKIKSLCSV